MHYSANDKLHYKYCITSLNPALKTKRQISDFWYLVQVFGRSNCAKSQIAFLYRNWVKKLFNVLRQIVTMKQICQHLRLQMKIMCRKFHIKTPFTFWEIRTWDMWKVCLQTFRNNRIRKKLAYFLRNLQTSRINNLRIPRVKKTKFSGYCFYMNTKISGDFQICISIPLIITMKLGNYFIKI